MMKLAAACAVVALIGCLCGCDQKPEPTYQGKRLSEWITLAKDKDTTTQNTAFAALANFSPDDGSEIVPTLKEGATWSTTAAQTYYRMTGDSAYLIPIIRGWLQNKDLTPSLDEADLARSFGADGKTLLPDLRAALPRVPQFERDQYQSVVNQVAAAK